MEDVMSKEVAEQELARITSHFEVEPEGKEWQQSKARLISAISKGRITLDEFNSKITLALVAPIQLANEEELSRLTFKEPTAADLKALDKYKTDETMSKTIHLASRMTGQPVGVIERMGARDLQTMGALTTVFF